MTRRLIFTLLIVISEIIAGSAQAQQLPVLLMLKRSEQVDTTGCNFVEQLTALVYDEIINNRLKLWDSQKKEIQIAGSTLKEIEKNVKVSFLKQETVFMYELWESNKKEIVTRTLGFSFVHKSNTEEEVSFGYVDYNDLQELFLKTKMNSNANGIYSSTYASYVLSKNFTYNIVQFGGKPLRSSGESEDTKKAYVKNLKFNETLMGYYPPDKYMNYIIDTFSEGTDSKTVNSKLLVKKLEEFFLKNQEVFFNFGGDRISSHLQKNKIKVTRIEVTEIWRKLNSEIVYDTRAITIYVNDSALNEITTSNIKDFEFLFTDQDLFSFFQSKNFNYIITKINSQPINRKDAYMYQKALHSVEWNKAIEYVVNY